MPETQVEQRVRAVEETLAHYKGALKLLQIISGIVGAVLLSAVGYLIYQLGSDHTKLQTCDSQIVEMKGVISKQDAELKTQVGKVDERLRGWEQRGFRVVQALVLDGEFVRIEADRIVIKLTDGTQADFVANPAQIAVAKKLSSGAKVRYMTAPAPESLSVFEPVK